MDPEGPRKAQKLRQTGQAAFAASSYSSWFHITNLEEDINDVIEDENDDKVNVADNDEIKPHYYFSRNMKELIWI